MKRITLTRVFKNNSQHIIVLMATIMIGLLCSCSSGTNESDFYGEWEYPDNKELIVNKRIIFCKDNTFEEIYTSKSNDYTISIKGKWGISIGKSLNNDRPYLWREYDINSIHISGEIDQEETDALMYIYKTMIRDHNDQLAESRKEGGFFGWGVPKVEDDQIYSAFSAEIIATRVK